jgi:hypothetical protein
MTSHDYLAQFQLYAGPDEHLLICCHTECSYALSVDRSQVTSHNPQGNVPKFGVEDFGVGSSFGLDPKQGYEITETIPPTGGSCKVYDITTPERELEETGGASGSTSEDPLLGDASFDHRAAELRQKPFSAPDPAHITPTNGSRIPNPNNIPEWTKQL